MTVQVPGFTDDQTYQFWQLRQMMDATSGPGVVSPATDFIVSASGLQVQVSSGRAFVQQTVNIDGGAAYNGLYMVMNDAPVNPYNTISAPLVNPRIDQVILRVYDPREQTFSGQSFARVEWLIGTENSSATLTTMGYGLSNPGAATMPANSLLLAYVLQAVGEGSVASGNIKNVASQAAQTASGTVAQRPVSAQDASLFHATDANSMAYYSAATSSWQTLMQLASVATTVSATAKNGQLVHVNTAGLTITLPAPTQGAIVGVWNFAGTGASPTTVTGSGGVLIYGTGVNGTSTWLMGTPNTVSIFIPNPGGAWVCISGDYDTGWVPLTLASSVVTASGSAVPSARLRGDMVSLNGGMHDTGSPISAWATIPSTMRPATIKSLTGTDPGNYAVGVTIQPSGALASATIEQGLLIDGLSYSMT